MTEHVLETPLTGETTTIARARRSSMSGERIRIEQHGLAGALWFWAWLFTIGLLHLGLGRALLAVVIWPYYLGSALAPRLLP
jgi:hypothetical protein